MKNKLPQPWDDNILVEPIVEEEKVGEIIIAGKPEGETLRGEVVNWGKGITGVKTGLIVYFEKFAGRPLFINDKKYVILKEDEILAVE